MWNNKGLILKTEKKLEMIPTLVASKSNQLEAKKKKSLPKHKAI